MKQKKTGKAIEVRLYKSHDADLLSLRADGYNVSKLLKEAVENYVAGTPVKYRLSGCTARELDDIGGVVRYHLRLSNEASQQVRRVRRGRRNQFIKMLLRDMLESEPLGGFFTNAQDTTDAVRWLKAQENAELRDLDEKKRKNAPAQKHKKADLDTKKEKKESEPETERQNEAEKRIVRETPARKPSPETNPVEPVEDSEFSMDSDVVSGEDLENESPTVTTPAAMPHRRFAEVPVETIESEGQEMQEAQETVQSSTVPKEGNVPNAEDTTKYREQTLLSMFDNMMEDI